MIGISGGGGRGARLSTRARRTLLAAGLVLAAAAAPALALTQADRTATREYLRATYQLYRSELTNAPVSRAALVALVQRLERECPHALAGEPKQGEEGSSALKPRARGELRRSELQRSTIESELQAAVSGALEGPNRSAIEAYGKRIAALHWSHQSADALAQALAALREPPPPATAQLCGDVKAWAMSGFRSLSPASRAFAAAQKVQEERQRERFEAASGADTRLPSLTGAAVEPSLRRRIATVLARLLGAVDYVRMYRRVQHALGVPESESERRERRPVLARGRLRDGARFLVRRATGEEGFVSGGCRLGLDVEISRPARTEAVFTAVSSSSFCATETSPRSLSLDCGEATQTITMAVPSRVRTVGLLLSDGQRISSRAVHIARHDGGPAALYVQELHGYEPHPVSLTELDARGAIVRVVRVPAIERCRKRPEPQGPRFVALVHGTAPGGARFAIEGAFVRFGAQTEFSVSAQTGVENGGGVESGSEIAVGKNVAKPNAPKPRPFESQIAAQCPPHPYTLVYGLLRARGASVLARTGEGLVPLTEVPIAAHLHAAGPLFYGVFAAAPSELVVRRRDGSVLYTESLLTKDREETEFCEGYAEP
ncbi:MAG TPA: hypothetical protein VGD00_07205 [Solirubrobacteraceae bacterium]